MRRVISLFVASLALTSCGEGATPAIGAKVSGAPPVEAGYIKPPMVTATRVEGAAVMLAGSAAAKAAVRLATPQGQAVTATADEKGAWSLSVPATDEAQIFGLSATAGGRTTQAEGYVLLTATGEVVLLRAGAGAVRVGRTSARSGVDAVDFDREGGAVVSGHAPANAPLSVHIDGDQTADGRADAEGRYSIAVPKPISPGAHQIDVFGDAAENSVTIDARPAAPISSGPLRSTAVPGALRIDWMTPGGGVQSTLLLE